MPTDPALAEQWRQLLAELQGCQKEGQGRGDIDEILIARYLAGQCNEQQRAVVEQASGNSPELRECMELAREVVIGVPNGAATEEARSPADGTVSAVPKTDGRRSIFRRALRAAVHGTVPNWAAAACLLVALGLGWLLPERIFDRRSEPSRQPPSQDGSKEIALLLETQLKNYLNENTQRLEQQVADRLTGVEKALGRMEEQIERMPARPDSREAVTLRTGDAADTLAATTGEPRAEHGPTSGTTDSALASDALRAIPRGPEAVVRSDVRTTSGAAAPGNCYWCCYTPCSAVGSPLPPSTETVKSNQCSETVVAARPMEFGQLGQPVYYFYQPPTQYCADAGIPRVITLAGTAASAPAGTVAPDCGCWRASR